VAHTIANDEVEYTTPDGRTTESFNQFNKWLDEIYPTRPRVTEDALVNLTGAYQNTPKGNEILFTKLSQLEQRRRGSDVQGWATTSFGEEWKLAFEALVKRGVPVSGLLTKDLNQGGRQNLDTQLTRMGMTLGEV
jgi:hypothetical protein